MPGNKSYSARVGQQDYTIHVGGFAQQAGGAVFIGVGDTLILVTATMSSRPREGIDFFPLSVDFEERMYAIGRIPGSFFRREGRPSEAAILISRVTDRPLRPLFPDGLRNEVQVILTPMSHDKTHPLDIMSIIGASAALMISDIPWGGPLGAARVGLLDGDLVVNPPLKDMERSLLNLRVAATRDAIVMVECSANEVGEAILLEALDLAHQSIQEIIELQEKMAAEAGRPKREYEMPVVDTVLKAQVDERVTASIADILRSKFDKDVRKEAMDELSESVVAEYESLEDLEVDIKEVRNAISENMKKQVRKRIVEEGVRPDGRDSVTLRDLHAAIDVLPRAHGSGYFQRGETQVLSVCTLGSPRDAQELDDLSLVPKKRYMHHYNHPPYSTGETYFLRGPKRREIGHGSLAENALLPVLPAEDDFPYTMRVVSEVLSSNGSTSMASVCGSSLSLMAAGVAIKRPVAGISMGLVVEGDKHVVLTDIQGMEDHVGDMDFKVAGTTEGVTALQMDIKISGVTRSVMERALTQARDARLQILEVMKGAIAEPRAELSPYAPRMEIMHIDPDKLGAVIGVGGKTVRSLQDMTNTRIEIEDDGTVYITGEDGPGTEKAVELIEALLEEPEVGRIYTGTISRIEPYGAFVSFLPGRDGMLHISQFASDRIDRIQDEFQVGDEIMVMVTDIDPTGKVRLSRQAVLEGWSVEEAQRRDRTGGGRSGGSRDRRGGGSRDSRSGGSRDSRGGGSRDRRGGSNRNRDRDRDRDRDRRRR